VTKKLSNAPISERLRVSAGRSSLPTAKINKPQTIGTKIANVSQGVVKEAISLAII
jgi:hypothetical protein